MPNHCKGFCSSCVNLPWASEVEHAIKASERNSFWYTWLFIESSCHLIIQAISFFYTIFYNISNSSTDRNSAAIKKEKKKKGTCYLIQSINHEIFFIVNLREKSLGLTSMEKKKRLNIKHRIGEQLMNRDFTALQNITIFLQNWFTMNTGRW